MPFLGKEKTKQNKTKTDIGFSQLPSYVTLCTNHVGSSILVNFYTITNTFAITVATTKSHLISSSTLLSKLRIRVYLCNSITAKCAQGPRFCLRNAQDKNKKSEAQHSIVAKYSTPIHHNRINRCQEARKYKDGKSIMRIVRMLTLK